MTFLSPFMLLGALAVGIPIAIHLFFRSRYRLVPWAAMKFLLTSIEQTSRRLRFQELLLLILRCTLLVVLALALARPISSVVRGGGRGDAVDAVFVFDTSYSMGASDGARSRLERAQDAALRVIEQLPQHSTVQIIACADRAALLGPRAPANLDQARVLVQSLRPTSLATDLKPGLDEAAEALARGQSSNKELYLLSDMQKLGWEQQPGGLVRAFQDIKDKATVFLVRAGTRTPANVAVIGITPQSGVPRPGERVGFAVLVGNTGVEPVKDVKISLAVDGDDKNAETQALAKIDPGETRALTLAAKLDKSGLRLLTAKIDHDDMPGDNRFDQVVLVRDQVSILVVDGNPSDRNPESSSSFFLAHALAPVKESERAKHHLQPRLVTPRLASPALLAKADLCILVNVALDSGPKKRAEALPADFVEELARFVRKGKGLIVYAGDNVQPEAYNRVLGQKYGLLPLPIQGLIEKPAKAPLAIDRASAQLPAYWRFKEDDYYKGFNDIQVWRTLELTEIAKEQEDATKPSVSPTVALRYHDGKPAVVRRQVDAGEVLLIATAAEPGFRPESSHPGWTDWPLRLGVYVPFVDVTVSHLLHGQTQTYNVTAGHSLDWFPPDSQPRGYTLVQPDGKAVRLGVPEKRTNRLVLAVPNLFQSGVYRLVQTSIQPGSGDETLPRTLKSAGTPLAVTPDLRESQDLEALGEEQLNQRLGFTPIHLVAGAAETNQSGADRLNREWTMWFLWALLALALGEMTLAYWCGRAW
ncbi:MAG: BatA domain-containing protein [Gemmataceae bacterium]|nr:BatA domain-containing protein [Gemmataceae bacterium]